MSKESVKPVADAEFRPLAEVAGAIGDLTLGSAVPGVREDQWTYFRANGPTHSAEGPVVLEPLESDAQPL